MDNLEIEVSLVLTWKERNYHGRMPLRSAERLLADFFKGLICNRLITIVIFINR